MGSAFIKDRMLKAEKTSDMVLQEIRTDKNVSEKFRYLYLTTKSTPFSHMVALYGPYWTHTI